MKLPVILASASPRRVELLKQVGIDAEIRPSAIKEDLSDDLPVTESVQRLALKKTRAAANIVSDGLIIGADTVVVSDQGILANQEIFPMPGRCFGL